jgi:hypothetical protein
MGATMRDDATMIFNFFSKFRADADERSGREQREAKLGSFRRLIGRRTA